LPRLRRLFLALGLALVGYVVAPPTTTASCHEGLPAETLDLIVVLDRSGSMAGTEWNGAVQGLTAFVNDPASIDVRMAMNFFPAASASAAESCESAYYNPPSVLMISLLPAAPPKIIEALNSETPTGPGTPTYGALYGSYEYATAHQDSNPDRHVIVALVTDGQPNSCPPPQNDIAEIANLAAAAYSYNGVKTYAIGLQGAPMSQLHQLAFAGNTSQAIDLTGDVTGLPATMIAIRDDAFVDGDGDGVGDAHDNCPTLANAGQEDLDNDCSGDICDDDIDGDGTPNASDAFVFDPTEDTDTDSDGLGNNADPDDDGDDLGDWIEISLGFDPLDSDSDDNGVPDCNDLIALLQSCANAVAPALTPSGTGVLLALLASLGIAGIARRRR
jgi:hypothetical protein